MLRSCAPVGTTDASVLWSVLHSLSVLFCLLPDSGLPVLPPSPAQSSARPAGGWAPPPTLLLHVGGGAGGRRAPGVAEAAQGTESEDGEIVSGVEGGP